MFFFLIEMIFPFEEIFVDLNPILNTRWKISNIRYQFFVKIVILYFYK